MKRFKEPEGSAEHFAFVKLRIQLREYMCKI